MHVKRSTFCARTAAAPAAFLLDAIRAAQCSPRFLQLEASLSSSATAAHLVALPCLLWPRPQASVCSAVRPCPRKNPAATERCRVGEVQSGLTAFVAGWVFPVASAPEVDVKVSCLAVALLQHQAARAVDDAAPRWPVGSASPAWWPTLLVCTKKCVRVRINIFGYTKTNSASRWAHHDCVRTHLYHGAHTDAHVEC